MRYNPKVSNARFVNGKPSPRFIGPTVLLDYMAPRQAKQYRKLKQWMEAEYRKIKREVKVAPTGDTWQDLDRGIALRKPLIDRLHRRALKRFAKICVRYQ